MDSRKPSEVDRHVDIALAALARGLIDMRTFAEAMISVGRGAPQDQVWLEPGRLQKKQLDSIVMTLADPVSGKLFPRTLLFGPQETESSPAEGDSESTHSKPTKSDRPKGLSAAEHHLASIAPTDPPPSSGHVEERYQIQRTLGGGGMGYVYECLDSRLLRRVALKSMRTEFLNKKEAILDREAALTARLEHPNIIPVYDAGKDATLGPYYVMRLVDRPSLENLLERMWENPALEEEHSIGKLLRIFVQVCHAVDYAHSQGVIHCDLKPANILIGPFGEVLVVDWGLARSVREDASSSLLGGTPGYMSPEQMSGQSFDLRTDVYALGSILYDILTLQPTFTIEQLTGPAPMFILPVKPSERAPKRNVPKELEDICLKALAPAPEDRYQFVREMAAALEVFLEGTREKERREAHATQLAENGDGLFQAYREFLDARPEQAAELDNLRRQTPPYGDESQKLPLWEAEERLAVVDNLAVRTLQAAIASYDQALDEVRDHAGARRGLAQVYASELERAIAKRDEYHRVYFEGLLKQYDDGTFEARLTQQGVVRLEGVASGRIRISRYELTGRRLAPEPVRTLEESQLRIPLKAGSYLLGIEGPGYHVRAAVFVKPGAETVVTIDPSTLTNVEPNMIYIPGGPALLRDDDGQPLREVQVPAFFMAEKPVTFGAYLEFLLEQYMTDPRHADERLPRSAEGEPYYRWDGRTITPASITALASDPDEALKWPVVGVDVESAMMYAAWYSKRTNRRYRLPSEDEWEKAARGVDGRRYPWGDHFDASYCLMRQSRPGVPSLEHSGTFPTDVSPYGVRDLAGGIADWVRPPPRAITIISRGGAWCDWPADCAIPVRRVYWANERSSRVGFRLARTPG